MFRNQVTVVVICPVFRYYLRRLRDKKGGDGAVEFSISGGLKFAMEHAFVIDEPEDLIVPKKNTIDIEFKDLSLKLKRVGMDSPY